MFYKVELWVEVQMCAPCDDPLATRFELKENQHCLVGPSERPAAWVEVAEVIEIDMFHINHLKFVLKVGDRHSFASQQARAAVV